MACATGWVCLLPSLAARHANRQFVRHMRSRAYHTARAIRHNTTPRRVHARWHACARSPRACAPRTFALCTCRAACRAIFNARARAALRARIWRRAATFSRASFFARAALYCLYRAFIPTYLLPRLLLYLCYLHTYYISAQRAWYIRCCCACWFNIASFCATCCTPHQPNLFGSAGVRMTITFNGGQFFDGMGLGLEITVTGIWQWVDDGDPTRHCIC